MTHSFLNDLSALTVVIVLFFSMLIAIWIGYKTGLKKSKSEIKNTEISSSLLGLLALILGFTFAMAGSRYENRKK
jgi:cytochrome bd-type quinol oxidase subunit 2